MLTLVTGATGLVGNNIVRMLVEQGDRVRALVRNPADKSLGGLPLDIVEGDVCDAATIHRAADGVDRIIHCAARVHLGWRGLDLHRSVNVEGTRNVARAAKDAGVRMVHVSSVDALGLGSRANLPTKNARRKDRCFARMSSPSAKRSVRSWRKFRKGSTR